MNAQLKDCLVIEDSVAGIRVAKTANMRVYGFTGGEHCDVEQARRLMEWGVDAVCDHVSQISKLLKLNGKREAQRGL